MDNTNKSRLQIFLEETYEGRVMEYSGRGMYGKKCLAVNLEFSRDEAALILAADIIEASHSIAERDLHEIGDAVKNTRVDNLGKGSVCYWPTEAYIEEEEEEDLEDA